MTDQKTLMAVCGHMDQIAGVRQMEFQDGRAAGLRTKLSAALGKLLDKAEQKVTVVQENLQGEVVEHPVDAEEAAK